MLLSLPCCGDTIHSPGAGRCMRPVLCLSHPWAILCSFSLSSHCSHQCCAPKPWDPRTAPRHLPRRRALSERAKLTQDCEPWGLRALWKAWQAVARQQTTEGSPPWPAGWGFCPFPSPPLLCHIIEVTIPANLQTEHFVSPQRANTAI